MKVMLSSRVKYAVRAVTSLAATYQAPAWTTTADIARREHIPRKFLEAILVQLRDAGLVDSRRGAHGGHRLAREPQAISLADVVRSIDGPTALTPCACSAGAKTCIECVRTETCQLRPVLQQACDAVTAALAACSLASLAGDSRLPFPPNNRTEPSGSAVNVRQHVNRCQAGGPVETSKRLLQPMGIPGPNRHSFRMDAQSGSKGDDSCRSRS